MPGFPAALGAGEREAITLAEELRADALLIDDQPGRREAARRDLPIQGTLGVLATAAKHGLISLPEAIEALQRTNFRMHPLLLRAILERHAG